MRGYRARIVAHRPCRAMPSDRWARYRSEALHSDLLAALVDNHLHFGSPSGLGTALIAANFSGVMRSIIAPVV